MFKNKPCDWDNHWWRQTNKTFEVCEKCEARFPCKGRTCAHLDCDEYRNGHDFSKGPKCHRCSRYVKSKTRFFVSGGGTRLHPVHEKCIVDGEIVTEIIYK